MDDFKTEFLSGSGETITSELWNGECLERMKDIKTDSIDMVMTDPPYGVVFCAWDCIIPFKPMWEALKRVTKKDGAIVMTSSQPFTTSLCWSNIEMFKQALIWKKDRATGFLNANRMHMRNHEDIVVFYRDLPVYNPQFGEGESYNAKHKPKNDSGVYGEYGTQHIERVGVTERFPLSVIEIGVDRATGNHPTQKPVALMEYLIRTFSRRGETVLDFTMGSGTTGVACKMCDRNFIGIEMDEGYFQTCIDRVEHTPVQTGLFDGSGIESGDLGPTWKRNTPGVEQQEMDMTHEEKDHGEAGTGLHPGLPTCHANYRKKKKD